MTSIGVTSEDAKILKKRTAAVVVKMPAGNDYSYGNLFLQYQNTPSDEYLLRGWSHRKVQLDILKIATVNQRTDVSGGSRAMPPQSRTRT